MIELNESKPFFCITVNYLIFACGAPGKFPKIDYFSYFSQTYYIKLFGVFYFVHLSTPPESKLATGLVVPSLVLFCQHSPY